MLNPYNQIDTMFHTKETGILVTVDGTLTASLVPRRNRHIQNLTNISWAQTVRLHRPVNNWSANGAAVDEHATAGWIPSVNSPGPKSKTCTDGSSRNRKLGKGGRLMMEEDIRLSDPQHVGHKPLNGRGTQPQHKLLIYNTQKHNVAGVQLVQDSIRVCVSGNVGHTS